MSAPTTAISNQEARQPLFALGRILATPGAMDALSEANHNALDFLRRHVCGDWGDVCAEDAQANQFDLTHGGRLFSVYHTSQDVKLWLITEADRSATTFLLPSEY